MQGASKEPATKTRGSQFLNQEMKCRIPSFSHLTPPITVSRNGRQPRNCESSGMAQNAGTRSCAARNEAPFQLCQPDLPESRTRAAVGVGVFADARLVLCAPHIGKSQSQHTYGDQTGFL